MRQPKRLTNRVTHLKPEPCHCSQSAPQMARLVAGTSRGWGVSWLGRLAPAFSRQGIPPKKALSPPTAIPNHTHPSSRPPSSPPPTDNGKSARSSSLATAFRSRPSNDSRQSQSVPELSLSQPNASSAATPSPGVSHRDKANWEAAQFTAFRKLTPGGAGGSEFASRRHLAADQCEKGPPPRRRRSSGTALRRSDSAPKPPRSQSPRRGKLGNCPIYRIEEADSGGSEFASRRHLAADQCEKGPPPRRRRSSGTARRRSDSAPKPPRSQPPR